MLRMLKVRLSIGTSEHPNSKTMHADCWSGTNAEAPESISDSDRHSQCCHHVQAVELISSQWALWPPPLLVGVPDEFLAHRTWMKHPVALGVIQIKSGSVRVA
mmetsp:Transcript_24732/g.53787  ORF Transcript_24732/g.53787 Transcript_24732/m.53787 type:complete len:103 (+) Transcript_24732:309-617(+)